MRPYAAIPLLAGLLAIPTAASHFQTINKSKGGATDAADGGSSLQYGTTYHTTGQGGADRAGAIYAFTP